MNVPTFVKNLMAPTAAKSTVKRVWGIELLTVWAPYFHATNVMGVTEVSAEALGAPQRLARNKDGSIRYSPATGRPVEQVVKELRDVIAGVQSNLVAGMLDFTGNVQKHESAAYKASLLAGVAAGAPLKDKDAKDLAAETEFLLAQSMQATAEAAIVRSLGVPGADAPEGEPELNAEQQLVPSA